MQLYIKKIPDKKLYFKRVLLEILIFGIVFGLLPVRISAEEVNDQTTFNSSYNRVSDERDQDAEDFSAGVSESDIAIPDETRPDVSAEEYANKERCIADDSVADSVSDEQSEEENTVDESCSDKSNTGTDSAQEDSFSSTAIADAEDNAVLRDEQEETVVGAAIRRDIADGLYLLVPKLSSSRCVSIAGNSKESGANVQLVTKNCGFAQAFYVKRYAGTSRYTFVNYHTGLALEMENKNSSSDSQSTVSANVIQNPLTNSLSQQWVLEDPGNGYLQIRACGKSLVLDLYAGGTAVGTNVQTYKANQTDAQMWKLVPAYGKIAAEARLTDANLRKGYYRIAPADNSGLSVDITSNSKASGANIRLYKKINTGAQIFRIAPEGDGTYVISGYNSGKFLDCTNAKAGTNIRQAASGNSASQRWFILKDAETGKFVIRNKNGSHVVMSAEDVELGANVGQESFAGKSSQYWTLTQVYGSSIHVEPKDGIYEIRSGLNESLCLDVAAGSSLNNANIQLYAANGTDAQRFAITCSGYGVYKVVNVNSMRVMHLQGNKNASGTNVLQYKSISSTAQNWKISWNSKSGGYQIKPNGKSLCLDVAVGAAKNGENVRVATPVNSARQMWVFHNVSSSYEGKYHVKVTCSGTTCVLRVYQVIKGVFTERLSTSGFIGRNGSGKTVEGDGKTPIGTFTVGNAYGIADDPGSVIPYKKVTDDMYWCGRSDSPYYNQLINAAKSGPGDEHLIDYTESYQYLLDIGYNPSGTPHLGSAIFLHCSRNQPTAGCVAIPKAEMARVLRMITPGSKISLE